MGRAAGIYLLTDASPMAPSTFDYWQFYGGLPPQMEELMEAFYRIPAHQPDVVAVFIDPRTYPLAPWARDLLSGDIEADDVAVGLVAVVVRALQGACVCCAGQGS